VAEDARARSWIIQTIKGDTTLAPLIGGRVHHGPAPPKEPEPFVTVELLSPGNDLIVVGGARVWSNMLWLVKVTISGNSTAKLEPIVDRIDVLLHNKSGTVVGGVIHNAVRERPYGAPPFQDNGKTFVQEGGEYRVKASVA
jgi:hypothetical protein